jgi:hypothetical protein
LFRVQFVNTPASEEQHRECHKSDSLRIRPVALSELEAYEKADNPAHDKDKTDEVKLA